MRERRQWTSALVAACLLATVLGASAHSQQGAPPPAVLVQPAELTPIADQLEFIGRAAAVDKVELRARVKGFLGPRKFNDGDQVKKDEVVFTIEPETYQAAVDQKNAQRDAAQAALTNAELQLSRATELLRTNTGTRAVFDQRTERAAPGQGATSRTPRRSCATPRSSSPTPRSSRRSPVASAAPWSRRATSSVPTPACSPRW